MISVPDRVERGPGLTDQEKLIIQKAKTIESKSKFKAKWPEPPRRKVGVLPDFLVHRP